MVSPTINLIHMTNAGLVAGEYVLNNMNPSESGVFNLSSERSHLSHGG